uniref:G-protein coupled receptors family 1 profile domain-containing protein n=2 Tax=Magallana gigas TaxID=29159 RepID=A0A8W8NGC5_MAGGI|nr:prostaglandin E2 receptor EP4 subtype [Crassostrea gigas]
MDLTIKFEITSASNSTEVSSPSRSSTPAVLQFVFGVLGNLIAIVVLITARKKHKWRPFYRLVFGLTLTDGFGILLIFPTIFLRFAPNFKFDFRICAYKSFMFIFILTSSAMIVCAMSFDRFMAILYPYRYNGIVKNNQANITLAVVWITCAFLSSLPLLGLRSSLLYDTGSVCFLNFISTSTVVRIYSFVYSLIGLFILLSTIIFNMCVVISLCKNIVTTNAVSQKSRKKGNTFNVVFLLVIVLTFATCWTPLMIVIFGHATALFSDVGTLELFAVRIGVTNSIIDPWIYILFRKENIFAITRKLGTFCDISKVTSNSVNNNVTPQTDAQTESDGNTSARTEHSIDIII